MNSAITKIVVPFLLVACLLFPHPVESKTGGARIADFIVTNTEEEVVVYLSLENGFTPELEEAVLAGITTTFIFTIELYQQRTLWFNRQAAAIEARHSIKYDSVKRTLYVSYSYKGSQREPDQFTELSRAKRAMSDLSGIPVAELSRLERGRPYYIRARAKLDRVPLPMDIRATTLFSSLWFFETDWARQDFVY